MINLAGVDQDGRRALLEQSLEVFGHLDACWVGEHARDNSTFNRQIHGVLSSVQTRRETSTKARPRSRQGPRRRNLPKAVSNGSEPGDTNALKVSENGIQAGPRLLGAVARAPGGHIESSGVHCLDGDGVAVQVIGYDEDS